MGRKLGLFFSIDAFIGGALLIVGMLLATSAYTFETSSMQLTYEASDVATMMTLIQNRELRDQHSISLMQNGSISKLDNTIIEQIAEFYALNKTSLMQNYTREALGGYFPTGSSYGIYIDNMTVYEFNVSDAKFRSSSRRAVQVITGSIIDNPVLHGPYIVRVKAWK